MDRDSLIFCVGSLILSLGVAALAFPHAALPEDALAASRTPQPAETLGDVALGDGFGTVPVVELMGYYVENPPVAAGPGAAPEIRFGGC